MSLLSRHRSQYQVSNWILSGRNRMLKSDRSFMKSDMIGWLWGEVPATAVFAFVWAEGKTAVDENEFGDFGEGWFVGTEFYFTGVAATFLHVKGAESNHQWKSCISMKPPCHIFRLGKIGAGEGFEPSTIRSGFPESYRFPDLPPDIPTKRLANDLSRIYEIGSEGWNRTSDDEFMRLTIYHWSTPQKRWCAVRPSQPEFLSLWILNPSATTFSFKLPRIQLGR